MELLPFLKQPDHVTDRPWHFDVEAYTASWQRMKSSISSSPTGMTFAVATADVRTASVMATMSWLPFHYAFSPTSWQTTTNTVLEKKKNDINVEKLRAIAFLDSQLNHNNKL